MTMLYAIGGLFFAIFGVAKIRYALAPGVSLPLAHMLVAACALTVSGWWFYQLAGAL